MLDWSSNDPNSAAEWLNAQPSGPQNDEILSTFSSAIIDIDPQAAVTWASEIYDEVQRDENLSMLLEEWVALLLEVNRVSALKKRRQRIKQV